MADTVVADLVARLRADTSGFTQGLGAAEHSAKGFGSTLGKIGTIATGVFGGSLLDRALDGVVRFARGAFDEANEAIKVGRETERVIESMGGVANVSVRHVEKLAEAISNKVGVDDEAIQSGANLLLTFGNIRNEVGAGNKIFDRAVRLHQDLATVMKMDGKSAAIMLGKALNDPIAGLTSLGRAGVQFTDQQKDQIKTLMESGDILGAQGIILAEVGRQVKGAAAAAATPMEKLQVRFKNVQEEIGMALMPALTDLSEWFLKDGMPAIERFIKWVEVNWPKFSQAVQQAWHVIEPIYLAIYEQLEGIVQLVDDLVHGRWSQIFGDLWEIVENAVGSLAAPFQAMWRLAGDTFTNIAASIWGVLAPPVNAIGSIFAWAFGIAEGAVRDAWAVIGPIYEYQVAGLNAIIWAAGVLAGGVESSFNRFKNAAIDLWNVASVPLNAIWNILNNIASAARAVADALPNVSLPGGPSLGDQLRAQGFSQGGWVGGTGNGDTVPAMLTPGEFVLSKDMLAGRAAMPASVGGGGGGGPIFVQLVVDGRVLAETSAVHYNRAGGPKISARAIAS